MQQTPSSLNHPASPFSPPLPGKPHERLQWGRCSNAGKGLAIAQAAQAYTGLLVVISPDVQQATQLENQLGFFLEESTLPILHYPDWEILPYDVFSPLPELVSQRLLALHQLQNSERGILIVPVATLLQRIMPPEYLDTHSLLLSVGEQLPLDKFRQRLERAGYQCVSQVMTHGEFAVRGSLLDLFPMGSDRPYRIDLFDEEIDSIRLFDPETQRSGDKTNEISMLPAREFPVDESAISHFRTQYRQRLEGDPQASLIYREVSNGNMPGGVECYLPLFFEQTATLFDYLPEQSLLIQPADLASQADAFYQQVEERYEQRRHDIERPILPPAALYLNSDELTNRVKSKSGISCQTGRLDQRRKGYSDYFNFDVQTLPALAIQARAARPAGQLQDFLARDHGRILFLAESAGRREHLLETLQGFGISPTPVNNWQEFIQGQQILAITTAPMEQGLELISPHLTLLPEALLLGERVRQARKRRKSGVDPDQVVRNLTELQVGSPVVHEEHGVGRYLGLQNLDVGNMEQEFLTIEYARGDKLYVPVSALHLISRYTGASEETAPLHKLGSDQWEKARRKAAEKVRDVAAELLEIYARREARQGYAVPAAGDEYSQFQEQFEFEETPDQQTAIEDVIDDMESSKPMDRVVCGDVGFGKTEVSMRAAFMAAQGGKQVAVLVPTTLLAQQHYENFADRFADWPIRIESLSRFKTQKEVTKILNGLAQGSIDIVVGTHKLLSEQVKFKDLGLAIIDEEHRFGVRHKERLKSLRAEVDILTLTATPIPRTLNMAMSGMRDLSIIATPPIGRNPIKTFIHQWNDTLISEACQREIKRGGQVYVLHNEVKNIQKMASQMESLVPGARVHFAHGQMRERELEQIMRDFYHQRFNILVSTTIIESGIDIPTANTIIINRADKLGLAQLHQLRGRVGRSHHRAYAYLITPPPKAMTRAALKRLEALESLEDLGAGFTLATHDLEIRGAGELLGEGQSGQIHEIGFTLYSEMLERAVQAIKAGKQPELDRPLDHGTEIDLHLPALLPEDYLPDVHIRLIQYKRIASATDEEELRELKIEMIDRFGLLPQQAKNLFDITELKLLVQPLGIRKIDAGEEGGRIHFAENMKIDPARLIHLIQTRPRQFKLDGNDKLKFFADLEDAERRVVETRKVIEVLAGV
jgi:transcription-repair coupling factor (superfamily II helicase)